MTFHSEKNDLEETIDINELINFTLENLNIYQFKLRYETKNNQTFRCIFLPFSPKKKNDLEEKIEVKGLINF